MQFETYHGKGDADRHGYDGPIHVSQSTFQGTKTMTDFLSAVEKVGYSQVDDMQSLDAVNGAQRALRYVNQDGHRQDTANRYLRPLLQDGKHPNLHVLVETQVERVLVEGGKATGVVFTGSDGGQRTVRAAKLVVVSCGALGTPTLLERSGIGSAEVLKRAGVETVVDLPGVGENYQDHQLEIYAYKSDLAPEDTLDPVIQGLVKPEDLIGSNSPMLGSNGQDITGKFRPTDDEVAALGPAFQKAWDGYYKTRPDKPLVLMSAING